MEGCSKPEVRRFQQSTSTRKASFKAPVTVIEEKVFNFEKQKHSADFLKKCEAIANYITVKYKQGGNELSMVIKNMDKPTINMPEA